MNYLSVCSGIEAATVAWHSLGWTLAAFSEIEPFPSAVLAHHYPTVPNLGDMTKIADMLRNGEIEAPDLLCGGTPCQAFSIAGLRNSLDDSRGNLSLTFCEIANEIDIQRKATGLFPAVVFWENVPGVLNTKDNAFGCFLAALAGEDDALVAPGGKWSNAGCVLGPQRTVAWRVLDAQYFGIPQRRRRVFVVASARDGFDPVKVLFEFDGVRRDIAPSRQAGQSVTHATAPCLTSSGRGVERASGGGGDKAHVLAPVCITGDITHTLKAEGFDASEDGTGRGQPIVTASRDIAQCLTGNYGKHLDNSDTALGPNVAIHGMAVRRLTPVECARLQGFPDHYLDITVRGKPAADGPKYKALGNSWAVPVVRWIGQRIAQEIAA